MIRYPLPQDLTRDRFHRLVTDLYYTLASKGIDPIFNIAVGDRDEVLDDGTTRTHFSLIISHAAADILKPTTES